MEVKSFIEKQNAIYAKLSVIENLNNLFDTNVIDRLESLTDLNLDEISDDLLKGSYLGNRKIDINLALNMVGITEESIRLNPNEAESIWTNTAQTVLYNKAVVTFTDGVEIEIPFTFDGNSSTVSTHGDLLIQMNQSVEFLAKLDDTLISGFSSPVTGEIIRIYDVIGSNSNIERITLNAVSGAFKEKNPIFYWLKTTSAFQTIAMRSGDIIALSSSLPKLQRLANSIEEVLNIQSKIPQFIDTFDVNGNPNGDETIYNNLSKLVSIYSNLTALITVYNDIKSGGTNYINTVGNAEYKAKIETLADSVYKTKIEQVIANLTAIQNASSNAQTATDKAQIATQQAQVATNKVALIQAIKSQAQTLTAGQNATATYDAVTNTFTFGIPSGLKGDRGDAFTVNSIGNFAQRSLYDSQLTGFSFLALDVEVDGSTIPHIYFKTSATAGAWSTGVPFGRGEKGDKGDIGVGIESIIRTSGDGSQGSTDVYTITLTNTITYNFSVYNGMDSDINSTDLTALSNAINQALEQKQDTLVSDVNIKTINNQSILGSGNITLDVEVVLKPSITFPTNGTVDFTGAITFSAFQASSNYKGVQDYIECVVATDAAFTNIIDSYISDVGFSSWTPIISLPLTVVYIKYRTGSDNHLSKWCETVSVTTINQGINVPTITSPLNLAVDLGKNVTITKSSFSPFGGLTEPLFSVSWQIATDAAFTNIASESLNDTVNKTSWTSGNLAVSTTYYVRVKDETENYESAYCTAISFTTKAQFTPTIGTQGEWGFGIAPTDEPFAVLGLAEMTGTNTPGHANYGNYIHTNGSIVCWNPKGFYRIGHASSPRFAVYGANAIDIVGTETFANETEANAGGYVLPRVFINNGAEKSGYFQDKYMNSKDGTTAGKSVFGGNPISLTTSASYNKSSDMTGCTGILADAVTLSRARGTRWNCSSAFMYAWAAMVSVAHGQAATSTANCAWYDATLTTNFPKGCNNGALSDTNDATVVYAASPDTAAKPKTGATSNFNKTTHNGCANGIADLNGGLFEVPIGITNYGTSATDTTAYSNDTIYVLKTTVDHASLTGGWNGATDAWGAAATLASRFDAVTSPHPIGSSTGVVYWGNGTNAVFSADASGVNRNLCGFIPKNSSASNATGINMMGNDYFYKYGYANQVPLCCGYWSSAANAGLFYRNFSLSRSTDNFLASFRASAYFG